MSETPESVKEIKQQLDAEVVSRFPEISTSDVAGWRDWTLIFAIAIRSIQVIVMRFKEMIDQKLAFLRPGTIGWYAELARQFQYGHNLVVKQDGSLGYEVDDPAARIISAVAVTETETGEVVLKVARSINEELEGLDQMQMLAFSNYISAVKFVGTRTLIVSTSADLVKFTIEVYYDPAYVASEVEDMVNQAFETFKSSLGFDGVIYRQRFIKSLMEIPGVVTVDLTSFVGTPAGGDPVSIDVKYESQAGYFNFDKDNSSLTLTPSL